MQPGNVSGTLNSRKSGGYSLNYQNPILTPDIATPWDIERCRIVDANGVCKTLAADKGRGHGVPTVAFTQNVRDEVRLIGGDGSHVGALPAPPGMKQQAYVCAFTERTRKDGRNLETQDELAYAVTNPGSGGRTHSRQIAGTFGVRRLTPRECERLQGFPDDWTLVDGMSDSARYRMLGNAVAVPVAEWIGRRIVESDPPTV